jgi:lipopolysaccharide/colanic/teichoic acid biosynthesis glycosyltransferase
MKPLFDFALASVLLVPLLPVMAVEAIAIALESRGPILFVQERIGRGGRPFRFYKFRTMTPSENSLDEKGKLKSDAKRITRLGRFLRRASLDELPQLFNILKGDMSFVGPRPTLRYQVERYDEFQRRRLEVKPGITGLAQIRGRNSLSWEEKIRHDIKYVDTRSFLLDLRILLATVPVVFKRGEIEFVNDDRISRID